MCKDTVRYRNRFHYLNCHSSGEYVDQLINSSMFTQYGKNAGTNNSVILSKHSASKDLRTEYLLSRPDRA